MKPTANPVAMLPVNGMPKLVTNAGAVAVVPWSCPRILFESWEVVLARVDTAPWDTD